MELNSKRDEAAAWTSKSFLILCEIWASNKKDGFKTFISLIDDKEQTNIVYDLWLYEKIIFFILTCMLFEGLPYSWGPRYFIQTVLMILSDFQEKVKRLIVNWKFNPVNEFIHFNK